MKPLILPTPILLYHSISENPGSLISPFNVRPKTFERHLQIIEEEDLETVTLTELIEAWNNGESAEKKIVITFDDGYRDFLETALPAMEKRGMTCSLYVTTGFIQGDVRTRVQGQPADRMLDWDQVREISQSRIEIGAHSHTHPHLDTLNTSQLLANTRLPKQLLEDKIQLEVKSFAYPHGYCGPRVQRFTREAGYANAAGVRDMFSHAHDDYFNIARLMLRSSDSLEKVRSWLQGQGAPISPAGEQLRTKLWRTYRRTKSLLAGTPVNIYTGASNADSTTRSQH